MTSGANCEFEVERGQSVKELLDGACFVAVLQ
jgi:hypothetical protein